MFKSFRHAKLLFSKNFTAIVGPNGSGKSNICDAILFCIGENSLHRLRANRLEDLILHAPKSHANTAYVKLELDGDEHIEISRDISKEGKSTYRLNGKHMTRQEVVEMLEAHGVFADERNTIAQGEIGKFAELNPKERRELIDAVAGIKEFEQKKEDALKELEKVNIKISEAQAILDERLGFLNELKREKEAAEAYLSMTAKLKQLNYSILATRVSITKSAIDSFDKDLERLEKEKEATEAKAKEYAEALERIANERQEITKKVEESTKSNNEINERLKEIDSQIAETKEKEIALNEQIENNKTRRQEIEEELGASNKSLEANKKEIEELSDELQELEKNMPEEPSEELEKISEQTSRIANIEKALNIVKQATYAANDEFTKHQIKIEALEKRLQEAGTEIKELEARAAELREEEKEASEKAKGMDEMLKAKEAELKELQKEIDAVDEQLIELKEKRALAAPKENGIKQELAKRFGEEDGFYGTVGELCKYDLEYALAIEAAAGNRLNYFVVDSIETASKIIEYMKANKIGRATFIPLQDIRVEPAGAKAAAFVPLLSLLTYDTKFDKAMRYVFGNTLIAKSLQEAKQSGLQARFVTKEGELLEPSGLVSGGTLKVSISPQMLDKQITELSTNLKELMLKRDQLNAEIFELRKSKALSEARLNSIESEIKSLEEKARKLNEEVSAISSSLTAERNALAKAKEELEAKKQEQRILEAELEDERNKLNSAYAQQDNASRELVEEIKRQVETIKIRLAELGKESELVQKRNKELEEMLNELQEEIVEKSKKLEELKAGRESLEKQRKEIEEKIKNSSEESRQAYAKIAQLEEEAVKLGKLSGEANAKLKELENQINETKIKKGQLDVRLSDLEAELATYEEGIKVIDNMSLDDMEKEANIISAKINDLGTVNLKAPEIYEEKAKEVEEAKQKLETLELERRSVINLIDEVEKKKLAAFMAAFDEINKNFEKMYNYVFPGSAKLELENPKEPFEGGLEIKITNASGSTRLATLSGGEKALVSLMLIFAIHMYKPASFYIFDEIDAALDKENSKKLSQLIKELSKNAQFIVVSHNDSMIVNADAAIGITKTNGESKAVGVEINSIKGLESKMQ